jgi:hypothetical protein
VNVTEGQSYQDSRWLTRAVGVFRSPKSTFEHVAANPRWAGLQAVTLGITLTCGVLLQMTEVGRQALVDQWERTAVAFGQEVDNEAYTRLEELSERGEWYAAASAIAGGPVLAFGLAAVLYAAFSKALGGTARFRQVLAVVVHAGVILTARQMLAAPVSFVRETIASPTRLTIFFPMLDEASPAARFFGVIDLFVAWWMVAIAIGMAVLYRRPARRLAVGFLGAYVASAVLVAIVMAVMGGTE